MSAPCACQVDDTKIFLDERCAKKLSWRILLSLLHSSHPQRVFDPHALITEFRVWPVGGDKNWGSLKDETSQLTIGVNHNFTDRLKKSP